MPDLPPNSSFQPHKLRNLIQDFWLGLGVGVMFSAAAFAPLFYYVLRKQKANGSGRPNGYAQYANPSETHAAVLTLARPRLNQSGASPRLNPLAAALPKEVALLGVMSLVVAVAVASQMAFNLGEPGRPWGILLFAALFPLAWLMARLEQRSPELKTAEQAEADLAPKTLFDDGFPTASTRLETPAWMQVWNILRTFARPMALWEKLTEQPLRMLLLALAFAAITASATLAPDPKNNLIAALLWTTGVVLFLIACLPGKRSPTAKRPDVGTPPDFGQNREILDSLGQRRETLDSKRSLGRRQSLLNWLAVVLLVAGSAAVLYRLESSPIGVEGDEGSIGSQAFEYKDGRTVSLFGVTWFYDQTAVFPYLQLASINLFGEDIGGLRVLSGVMGSLGLLLVYLLARRMFGPGPALVTAALFAFAPYHLLFSRMGIHDMVVLQLFIPALLYFLYRGLHTGHYFDFAAAGVVMGIGLWLDYNNKIMILIPLAGATFLYLLATRLAYWRTEYPKLGVCLVGVVIVLLPMWAALAQQEKLWQDPARGKFIFGEPYFSGAVEQYGTSNVWLIMLYQTEYAFFGLNHFGDASFMNNGPPMLDSLTAVFFFIGLAYSVWRWKEPRYAILLILLGVGLQMQIWSNAPPQAHRMTPVIVVAYLLAGVGVATLGRLCRAAMRWPVWLTAVFGLLLVGVVTYNGVTTYFAMEETEPRLTWLEMAEVGKVIREFSPTHDVYYVGGPRAYASGHGAILFSSRLLSREAPTLDEVSSVLPLPQPAGRDTVFIFSHSHLAQLQAVRQHYPQGTLKEWRRGKVLYLQTYTVSREEINRIAYLVSRIDMRYDTERGHKLRFWLQETMLYMFTTETQSSQRF